MEESIIVVSGIPRSGTSMVMEMLDRGGLDVVTDNIRKADRDNPMGYYEYEKVKSLEKDNTWLDDVKGRGIKIISHLLYFLPLHLSYKIVFMERDMQEIVVSQRKMYERLQKAPGNIKDSVLATKFNLHLRKIYGWIGQKEALFLSNSAVVRVKGILIGPIFLNSLFVEIRTEERIGI